MNSTRRITGTAKTLKELGLTDGALVVVHDVCGVDTHDVLARVAFDRSYVKFLDPAGATVVYANGEVHVRSVVDFISYGRKATVSITDGE